MLSPLIKKPISQLTQENLKFLQQEYEVSKGKAEDFYENITYDDLKSTLDNTRYQENNLIKQAYDELKIYDEDE